MPPAEVKHLESGRDALPAHPDSSPPQGTSAPCNLGPRNLGPPNPGPPLPDAPIPRRYLAGGAGSGGRRQVVLSRKRSFGWKVPELRGKLADFRPAAEPPGG